MRRECFTQIRFLLTAKFSKQLSLLPAVKSGSFAILCVQAFGPFSGNSVKLPFQNLSLPAMKNSRLSLLFFSVLIFSGFAACISPGNKGRNPYDDHRVKRLYDVQFAKIYLRDVGGLVYKLSDSVIWASDGDDRMGLFGVWFLEGERFNLSDPNIQIGYFSKKLPGQESKDKLFAWVEKTFVQEKRGNVIQPRTELPTYSGKSADYMTISFPPDTVRDPQDRGKWISYAYIEQDQYMIAFVLTAYEQIRFERLYRFYKDLVGTYEEN